MAAGDTASVSAAGHAFVGRDTTPPTADAGTPPPAPRQGLSADMIEITRFNLDRSGNVTANPKGTDVRIKSPGITFSADFKLATGVVLDETAKIQVGPTQSLLGSERIGIYKNPAGTVVAEYRGGAGQLRDAQWKGQGNNIQASFPAPWYSQFNELTKTFTGGSVGFVDEPRFEIPARVGAGVLTETRGSERFITALSAKRDGTLIHLRSEHWEVPWNVTIDPGMHGLGQEVTGGTSTQGPPTLDGPIVMVAAQDWMRFPTVADAQAAGVDVLLANLASNKKNDPPSYANMVAALRALNPTFNVKVACKNSYAWVGKDRLMLEIKGHISNFRGFELDTKEVHPFAVTFNDLFDAGKLADGDQIRVSATVDGHTLTASLDYPFAGHGRLVPMVGSDGRYEISLTRTP
jgi:hypothetical protein